MAEGPGDTKHTSKGVTRGRSARLHPLLRTRQIKKDKLSVLSKLCYAIGGAPNQISGSASAFFLQIYLLDVAQITPLQTSLVLSVGKVWGGITDPIVGYFINKSKWTKIGRLMPWMIGCTPFLAVSYFFLWFASPFVTGRVLWYLIFYCLYQGLTTVFHVPYSTLTMFLSTEQKERDSAIAYRMTVELLGTLLGAAIQGQIVASAHTSAHCLLNNATADVLENTTYVSLVPPNSSLSQPLAYQLHAERVYMIAAGIIGGVYLFCANILFFGVKEKDDPYALDSDSVVPFFRGFKLTMRHGPYLNLTAAFLLIFAAFQLEQNNFVLFCTHTADLRDHFQNLVLTILVSAMLSIPFWQWVLQKFGKKSAAVGISWMIPFAVLLVTVPNLIVAYLVAVTSGLSIAASLLLPWSMLPDVIDDFRLLNPQAKGLETIFYSSFVFFTRLSAGIALGISTLSLEFTGYITGACKQSYRVAITLRILIGGVPAGLIIIGLLILIFYPITEKKRKETENALNMMRYQPKRRLTLLG